MIVTVQIHQRPFMLAPGPGAHLDCRLCGLPGDEFVTGASNPNGNAGRPYFRCGPCNKFLSFSDTRGNDPNNLHCDCGLSRRLQVAGLDREVPRGAHYVCRVGRCGFFLRPLGPRGEPLSLLNADHDLVQERITYRVI